MSTTIAILVTDAEKDTVTTMLNELTPEYTVGFVRKVAALGATDWQTPASHWYTNAQNVPDEVVTAWQTAASTAAGIIMFTAINADNAFQWAQSNLASQGLMFVPDQEV